MIVAINEWWLSMILAEKIFWGIAFLFSAIFLLQILHSFFEGKKEFESHLEEEEDVEREFQFLTPRNFIGFFTVVGWTGVALLQADVNVGATVFIAALVGFIMMIVMASIAYFKGRLTDKRNNFKKTGLGNSENP